MPETARKISPELGIKLEREQPAYTLPDTVVGHVFRKTPLVASKATLTIAVVGRSKSRMVVRHGSWGRIYRGRFTLLDEEDNKQTLLQAPVHIPADAADEKRWPFAVTLPTQFDASRAALGASQEESFLTIGSRGSAMSSLPPSFLSEKWGFGEGMGCFVEYFLKAELTVTSRGSSQVHEAIQPLMITTLHHYTRPTIDRWNESRHEHCWYDTGSVVQPDGEQGPGSTLPRQDQTAESSSLSFTIVVQTPKILELDQSSPVPLLLMAQATPMHSSGVSRLTSHTVAVTKMLLDLVASTSIKCHGRRSARDASIDTKFKISTRDTCSNAATLNIPWSNNSSAEHANEGNDAMPTSSGPSSGARAINAGRYFGLRIPDEGVYESFTTHNIHQQHRLEWKITVEIASQSFTFSGAADVEIIAPSRDNEPIDYATLETESLERRQSTVSQVMPPVYGRSASEQALPPRPRRHDKKGGSFGLARLWEGL